MKLRTIFDFVESVAVRVVGPLFPFALQIMHWERHATPVQFNAVTGPTLAGGLVAIALCKGRRDWLSYVVALAIVALGLWFYWTGIGVAVSSLSEIRYVPQAPGRILHSVLGLSAVFALHFTART